MTGNDIPPEAAQIIEDRIGDALAYVGRLKARMELRRFKHDDPLYLEVVAAFNALHSLRMSWHYLGCGMADGAAHGKR